MSCSMPEGLKQQNLHFTNIDKYCKVGSKSSEMIQKYTHNIFICIPNVDSTRTDSTIKQRRLHDVKAFDYYSLSHGKVKKQSIKNETKKELKINVLFLKKKPHNE